MVWCWQQAVDLRPTASGITAVAKMDQFLRLADAIRVNNFGSQVRERDLYMITCFVLFLKVAGSCYRILKTSTVKSLALTPHTPVHYSLRPQALPLSDEESKTNSVPLFSPLYIMPNGVSGAPGAANPDPSQSSANQSQPIHQLPGKSQSNLSQSQSNVTQPQSGLDQPKSSVVISPEEEEVLLSTVCNESGYNLVLNGTEKKILETVTSRVEANNLPTDTRVNDDLSPMSTASTSSSVHFKPQARVLGDTEGVSHRGGAKVLPSLQLLPDIEEGEREGEEESHRFYQVWVVSSANHNSVATVVEYCGQFMKIEVNISRCLLLLIINFVLLIGC